jgi:hypothetical protein
MTPKDPEKTDQKKSAQTERQKRLGDALRANLRKRKSQSQEREKEKEKPKPE